MHDLQTLQQEYIPLVWRTVYRLLANYSDSQDCLQDTFLTAFERSKSQTILNWPGLLQGIATHKAIDLLRRRDRLRARERQLAELIAPNASPDQQAQNSELADRLRRALAELTDEQAAVFCLRNFNNMTYDQIAGELEISTDAVGVTLHRARERLKQLLASTFAAAQLHR